MIYKLQRKFIRICIFSLVSVVSLVLVLTTAFNIYSMNENLDRILDRISDGGGRFPSHIMVPNNNNFSGGFADYAISNIDKQPIHNTRPDKPVGTNVDDSLIECPDVSKTENMVGINGEIPNASEGENIDETNGEISNIFRDEHADGNNGEISDTFRDEHINGIYGEGEIPNIPKDDKGFMSPETPYATRYFTVFFDADGNIDKIDLESIHSVNEDDVRDMTLEALDDKGERGWIDHYRYKKFSNDGMDAIAFVDGDIFVKSLWQSLSITFIVFLFCVLFVSVLVILISKKVVRPIADSYEKQRQFVTDASHELKTPLTLILANTDIAEGELGQNEWLDDIRSEGGKMSDLVNQLVSLSRMDEGNSKIDFENVEMGKMLEEAVYNFVPVCENQNKKLLSDIDTSASLMGDGKLIDRLIYILLDNASKYCDVGGEINVKLTCAKNVVLTVENTYNDVDSVELCKLFDRFYRHDKSRTTVGYGIGLSMAKAIAEKHKGEIVSYKKDATHIGFKVTLKRN